jgi:hypothetical protein
MAHPNLTAYAWRLHKTNLAGRTQQHLPIADDIVILDQLQYSADASRSSLGKSPLLSPPSSPQLAVPAALMAAFGQRLSKNPGPLPGPPSAAHGQALAGGGERLVVLRYSN